MLFRFKYSYLFIFFIYISSFSQSFAATKVWYVINAVLMVATAQQACEILEARIEPGTLSEVLTYELGSVANEQVAACLLGTGLNRKYYPVSGRRESYHLFQPQRQLKGSDQLSHG